MYWTLRELMDDRAIDLDPADTQLAGPNFGFHSLVGR